MRSGHETTAPEQKWSEFLLQVNPRGREQRGRSPKATARKPAITILVADPAVLIAIPAVTTRHQPQTQHG
ncbi:MAG: hypothetical protein AN484_27305 [Aphanizomenon flos-aquae WA102]|uniref:Uncharacterized protein n=1 Tax=Aphanizomenon flos-aquae WA102 TaxID=1710896 RepID=A0A1B7W887_APHFL|nr:MAG: hypothetical protein AN484_27305 [Aphanizomenon flos-aquae WA102]